MKHPRHRCDDCGERLWATHGGTPYCVNCEAKRHD